MKHGGSLLLAIEIYPKFVIIRVHLAVGLPHKSNIKNSSEVDTSIFYVLYLYILVYDKESISGCWRSIIPHTRKTETDKEVMEI